MLGLASIAKPAARRPSAFPFDVNQIVGLALQLAAPRIEERAHLLCSLGDPPTARGQSAAVTQCLVHILVTLADALPTGDPRRAMIRITTVGDPDGRCCIDILVAGAATRELTLRSVNDFDSTARRAGAAVTCEREHGVGVWVRLSLPPR